MSRLTADRFEQFYEAIHGYAPFPWQARLGRRVCNPQQEWPRAIALPTAAGKTACIDIAVFALARQAELGAKRRAPRRIFFAVDRRVIVDQAHYHAEKLARRLRDAKNGVIRDVADALRKLACDDRPLDVYALRGGMYRETAWARSPLQPTIIASTVDQVGSRLLFRGYGVSDSMKPIHAGLVGNDSLILLDEAHCAKAFEQTSRYVEKYRQWGDERDLPPFRFVAITATPSGDLDESEIERDEEDDRLHKVLGPRIAASKPTSLVVADRAKGKRWNNWGPPLADELTKQARGLMAEGFQAVGILVNRVATARGIATRLSEPLGKKRGPESLADVILLTGRLRPVDRDAIIARLEPLFSGSKANLAKPVFVVATQCLEVGADLDFHALVTECASLDALRQRFGRLNRVAARPSAKAVVVVRADQTEDSAADPVYGASLANTWKWLTDKANNDVFDFGVSAVRRATDGIDLSPLNNPSVDAPVLFPAHLDCWVQTNPIPTPDPDPALFLHGPQIGIPDVQVVLRADLSDDPAKWAKIVSLCPPSSSEVVPVRIDVFRHWLAELDLRDESGDLEGEAAQNEELAETGGRTALRWAGPFRSETISDPAAARPGDTFVIRTTETGLGSLGDFPSLPPSDCGDEAFQRSRDKPILRLVSLDLNEDDDNFETKLTEAITARRVDDSPSWLIRAVDRLANPKSRTVSQHPLGGWIVTGKQRLHQFDPTFLEDDESSESPTRRVVTLDEHSHGVADFARKFAAGCGLDADLYTAAGFFHDIGKVDPRFQAMLQGRSPRTASVVALAKSGTFGSGDRSVHRYPVGARHELLSTALLATKVDDDLLLHLIATHHGCARPFTDYVEENDAAKAPFTATLFDRSFSLESSAQLPAQWNPDLAERFWRIVRKFGWWGAAYREAVFRLADQAESRAEQEHEPHEVASPTVPPFPPTLAPASVLKPMELTGLDGSNPLAFLAALGTLRLADQLFRGNAKLSWIRKGHWTPVLNVPAGVTTEQLIEQLHELVHRVADPHASNFATELHKEYRARLKATNEVMKSIKDRRLRGDEREAAVVSEFVPLQQLADAARAAWLRAHEATVAAPFLSIGKALSVTADEFRTFTRRTVDRLLAAGPVERANADFAAAFGCEACAAKSGRIIPTDFQLITGSGHQFFLETFGKLMETVSPEQLRRALFGPWTYPDPRLSFRWDPLDDRRYAYAWGDPSNEEVRTEHGANLLAAFAIPLFPLIPTIRGPVTTGFDPASDPRKWTWPLWLRPMTLNTARSLLAAPAIYRLNLNWRQVSVLAVAEVFRAYKIEVGRPPLSKLNLTAAVPL